MELRWWDFLKFSVDKYGKVYFSTDLSMCPCVNRNDDDTYKLKIADIFWSQDDDGESLSVLETPVKIKKKFGPDSEGKHTFIETRVDKGKDFYKERTLSQYPSRQHVMNEICKQAYKTYKDLNTQFFDY